MIISSVTGAVLGLIVGSFVAVVAMRWPEGRPFLAARSACDSCGQRLRWWELVPLLSFLALRGRCARCAAPVDRLHLIAELAGAAIGAAAFAAGRPEGALFGWALLFLALTDARHFWLPDKLTLPLTAAGLALGLPTFQDRLIGAAAGWASLILVALAYHRLRGRTGLGRGDAKLFAAIGGWLGWRDLPLILLAASLAGLAWALARGMKGDARLPLGTLLALAAYPVWVIAAH